MSANPLPSNTGAYVKTLRIIFAALIAGLLFFAIVAVFLRQTGAFNETFPYEILFLLIVALFAVSSVGAGLFIFNKSLAAIREKGNLNDKLLDYRSALIVKYATTEAPSFFAIIAYLLTGSFIILGIGLAIIAYFTSMWPTAEKIAAEMNLNPDEKAKLENPGSFQ